MRADDMRKSMNLFQIHEYVESLEQRIKLLEDLALNDEYLVSLEQRIEGLENVLTDFMQQYGPDVQKRRSERDAVWDEMIRVLTIQKRDA
tara:strand:+ start:663 stop:932 length:270 start_codon:yes stop_codon:yes gene_type:complete